MRVNRLGLVVMGQGLTFALDSVEEFGVAEDRDYAEKDKDRHGNGEGHVVGEVGGKGPAPITYHEDKTDGGGTRDEEECGNENGHDA